MGRTAGKSYLVEALCLPLQNTQCEFTVEKLDDRGSDYTLMWLIDKFERGFSLQAAAALGGRSEISERLRQQLDSPELIANMRFAPVMLS